MAIIWVKNNTASSMKCHIRYEKTVGSASVIEDKDIIFYREKVNSMSGLIEHNGYTAIEDEDLKHVKENAVMKSHFDASDLVEFDAEPDDAMTAAQKVVMLRAQVADLTAKNTDLASKAGQVDTLTAQVADLTAKNTDLASKADQVDTLTAQVADLTAKNADLTKQLKAAKKEGGE